MLTTLSYKESRGINDTAFKRLVNKTLTAHPELAREDIVIRRTNTVFEVLKPELLDEFLPNRQPSAKPSNSALVPVIDGEIVQTEGFKPMSNSEIARINQGVSALSVDVQDLVTNTQLNLSASQQRIQALTTATQQTQALNEQLQNLQLQQLTQQYVEMHMQAKRAAELIIAQTEQAELLGKLQTANTANVQALES